MVDNVGVIIANERVIGGLLILRYCADFAALALPSLAHNSTANIDCLLLLVIDATVVDHTLLIISIRKVA